MGSQYTRARVRIPENVRDYELFSWTPLVYTFELLSACENILHIVRVV